MTVINLKPFADVLGGVGAVKARFSATAKRAEKPVIRITDDVIVFPKPVLADYIGGVWHQPVDLAPLPLDCYWEIQVRDVDTGAAIIRTVMVPNATSVDFEDLVDVNPTSGEPSSDSLAAWTTTLIAVQQLVQAAQELEIQSQEHVRQVMQEHVQSTNPHPAYDDVASYVLSIDNALI